jgi:hypothetical protein
MKCAAVRNMLFRKIDNELSDVEQTEFDAHLAECPFCAREYRLLSLPSRIGKAIPPIEPSPYFYSKLMLNLEGEAKNIAGWQVFFGLARHVIPALAGITLALLTVFAYVQLSSSDPDLYRAYNRVFITEDQPAHRMLTANQGDITDESVLTAIAERESNRHQSMDRK